MIKSLERFIRKYPKAAKKKRILKKWMARFGYHKFDWEESLIKKVHEQFMLDPNWIPIVESSVFYSPFEFEVPFPS